MTDSFGKFTTATFVNAHSRKQTRRLYETSMIDNRGVKMFSLFGTRRTKANKKGFTLVELMIVVAVMAVLVAVAVPIYRNVSSHAEKQTCITNMRIMSDTLNNYRSGFSRDDSMAPITLPDFTITRVDGYPEFSPPISDPLRSRFLTSVQDPISLCCTNPDGVISVHDDGTKIVVSCSIHSSPD